MFTICLPNKVTGLDLNNPTVKIFIRNCEAKKKMSYIITVVSRRDGGRLRSPQNSQVMEMLKQVMKNSVRLEEEAKEADQESTGETPTEID